MGRPAHPSWRAGAEAAAVEEERESPAAAQSRELKRCRLPGERPTLQTDYVHPLGGGTQEAAAQRRPIAAPGFNSSVRFHYEIGQQARDDFPARILLLVEHVPEGRTDQGVAEGAQGDEQDGGRKLTGGGAGGVAQLILNGVNKAVHGGSDWLEMREIAFEHDPGGQLPRPPFREGVEHGVDQFKRRAVVCPQARDRRVERIGQVRHHRPHKRRLKALGRSEMVDEVGMRHPQIVGHRLEGDGIRPPRQEPCAGERQRFEPGLIRSATATADSFY